MADIEENKHSYESYDWRQSGEEWSYVWGGSDQQWYGSILPRIHRFLPADTILEIGAGFGRWADFFRPHCEQLILVDVAQVCVEACNRKYAGDDAITAHLSDGKSIDFIPDKSVDFVFSFHSLVWADSRAWEGYIKDIARILTTNGAAFLHHSVAGDYTNHASVDINLLSEFRDTSVSSETIRDIARHAGLRCSGQEIFNWETSELLDCFSVLARPGSLWGRGEVRVNNPQFRNEMANWGQLAGLYALGQTVAQLPELYTFTKTEEQ